MPKNKNRNKPRKNSHHRRFVKQREPDKRRNSLFRVAIYKADLSVITVGTANNLEVVLRLAESREVFRQVGPAEDLVVERQVPALTGGVQWRLDRVVKYATDRPRSAEILNGSRVRVYDGLDFKDDVSTPVRMLMRPATVVCRYGCKRELGGEIFMYPDNLDVVFDHRPKQVSHGHFTEGAELL